MPDEAIEATPVDQDATPEATPEEGAPAAEAPAVDWEKRYNDQRSEFDRRGSELQNHRFMEEALTGAHGPEQQAMAFQRLGIEYQQAEPEEEVDPFEDPYEKRLGKLEQELASKSEAEEQANFEKLEREYIDTTVSDLEKQFEAQLGDKKLTQREKKFVELTAKANRHEDGRPDLEGAVQEVIEARNEARDGYIASKKSIKPPVGSAGEEKVDFSKMTPEQREAWMVQDIEARQAAEGS